MDVVVEKIAIGGQTQAHSFVRMVFPLLIVVAGLSIVNEIKYELVTTNLFYNVTERATFSAVWISILMNDIVINKDMISLENINIFIGETQPTG